MPEDQPTLFPLPDPEPVSYNTLARRFDDVREQAGDLVAWDITRQMWVSVAPGYKAAEAGALAARLNELMAALRALEKAAEGRVEP